MYEQTKVVIDFVKGDDVYVVFPEGVMVGPVKVTRVVIPERIPFYEVTIPAFVTGKMSHVESMSGTRVFKDHYKAQDCLRDILEDQELVSVSMVDNTIEDGREMEQEYPRGTCLREVIGDLAVRLGLGSRYPGDVMGQGFDTVMFGAFAGDGEFKELDEWEFKNKIGHGRSLEVRLRETTDEGEIHEEEPATEDEQEES
jgi:hypothetical protein